MIQFIKKLQYIDRRFIFLMMAVAIFVPLVFPSAFVIPFQVNKPVQDTFDAIDNLPPGSTVIVSADLDPAAKPELAPFMDANFHHLFEKDIKVVAITLWPYGPGVILPPLQKIAEEHGKVRGKDWTFLGFKDGKEFVMKALAENIPQTFPVDYWGTPLGQLPIMQGIQSLKDVDLLIDYSGGYPGTKEWVLQVVGPYNIPMVSACTAVQITDYVPYYQSGQLKGLSGGMPGSAQYEKLVGRPGLATVGLNVLNVGNLFIILAIVVGNLSFFVARRYRED